MTDPASNDEPTDVADEEARAIADEISAGRIKPDDRLTAPTTQDPATSPDGP